MNSSESGMIEKMVNPLFNRAHEAIDLEVAGVLRRRDILAGAVAAAAMKSLPLAASHKPLYRLYIH